MTTRSSATADAGRARPTEIQSVGALLGGELPAEAVVVGPAQVARLRVEQVEDGALAADQPARELDDLLEDLGRVAQRRDAGGDLAQGLLGLGAAARSSRERSSSSMSRALVIAIAAWSAIASSSLASSSAHASLRPVKTVKAPNGPASPTSGAAITEAMPAASTYVSAPWPWGKRSSLA